MRVILLYLFTVSVLFSVTPGKWSYMDQFVLPGTAGAGPNSETVKDSSGKVIYRAAYTYGKNGKLVNEKYYDGSSPDGRTEFSYKGSIIVKEVLYDKTNKVMEYKKYIYAGSELKSIELYDDKDDKLLTCRVGDIKKGFIYTAETVWVGKEDKETFRVTKEVNSNNLLQSIYDGSDKMVGTLKFILDKNGRIIKRENKQQGQERINTLEYDSAGRLIRSEFHVKQGKEVKLVKTHFFDYDSKTKGTELIN